MVSIWILFRQEAFLEATALFIVTSFMFQVLPAVWFIVGATMRTRLAVCRVRMRITIRRIRARHVGSRLAFRGKIVKALSVSEFKALNEIA